MEEYPERVLAIYIRNVDRAPDRVAAVQALAEAKTGAAMAALQSLANDREKEVREAVVRALVAGQSSGKDG